MAHVQGPPSEPEQTGAPVVLPPPRTRQRRGRAAPSLTLGSRTFVMAIAALLLGTTFVAGVLGYRDHRDDHGSSTRDVAATSPSTTPQTSAPPQTPPTVCKQTNGIPAAAGKPTDISVPPKPVTKLQTRDLTPGRGKAAADGDKLTMQYVGVSCASGKQIGASWDTRTPTSFTLGAGNVIPGWDRGIKGMKAGGRRLLWVPASLGYGAEGRPPAIAPGDTLIFVVDLVKIG